MSTSKSLDSVEQSQRRWSLCGSGTYELSAAGQSVGTETFSVTCAPDGSYASTARTQLTPLGLDLTTKLELGKDLLPRSVDVKGTVRNTPFDQSATFDNGSANVSANGQRQTVAYQPTASWVGGNIFFANMFAAARYDDAKGGAQEIPMFPQGTLTIERLRADTVTRDGASATFDRFVMRIGPQEIVLWRDTAGKLAVIGLPSQQFSAALSEHAKWAAALLATPASAAPKTPSSSPSTAPTPTPPAAVDYGAPPGASFTAEEVTIPVGSYSLGGTLLTPKAGKRPYSAVVMITGSGLQTRDSRIPLPGLQSYAPFRQIAERLAAKGVAVLRVDDRGIGASTGRETLANATTSSLAEDTRAQVAWLRRRPEIDATGITLIGHSEGAAIAAMVAASDPKVRAVVLMAGTAKPGSEVSFEQQEALLEADTTLTDAKREELREQQRDAVKTVLAGGEIPGQPSTPWVREYFSYDPVATIRKVKQPVLILQGERDRQVYQQHATMLADALRSSGNKSVTMQVFPTLNHLFLPSVTGSFTEYSHLETTTVPDVVLDAIVRWVK